MTIATKRLQENFGRAASAYDAHAWLQRQQVERVMAVATEYLPAHAQILDAGCGTGYFGELTQLQQPGWKVRGLDVAFAMAKQAAPRCASVVQGDAAQLPFANQSLDAVVSSLCMQWIDNKAAFLTELKRVLKPGGMAILTTLGVRTLQELHLQSQAAGLKLGLLAMLPAKQYRALAEASGMEVLAFDAMHETRHYESLEALLESMRVIGAGNAGASHFLPPKKFARFAAQFEAGISATWEPICMVLKNR